MTIDILLACTVVFCWLGVLGMWRMREPVQALHYLALPAGLGNLALTLAVFLAAGWGFASLKMLCVAIVLLAINSIVAHATARAFRVRALGHWQPRDGDPFEWIGEGPQP